MSTNSNDNKVILSDDLILLIFSFIENPFHNSIPLSLLFCDKKDYIRRRKRRETKNKNQPHIKPSPF